MRLFNDTARQANEALRAVAADPGIRFEFADIYDVMRGADVCKNKGNLINRVIPSNQKWSFHPTVGGQDRIAEVVKGCIDHFCGAVADTSEDTYARGVSLLDDGYLAFDQIQWFWGKDAVAACQREGRSLQGALCNHYYYTNANPRMRAAKMADDVVIRTTAEVAGRKLEGSSVSNGMTEVTLDDLERILREQGKLLFFRFTVKDGKINTLEEVFTP